MRKPYKEILADSYYENLNNLKEQGFKIAEFFEKIVVWLIGLATGSIILILKENDKLNFIDRQTINITLSLLVLCIVFGILGRILYAIAIYIGYSFIAALSTALKLFPLPDNKRILLGTETKEEIILFFQEDFNIDVLNILQTKNETIQTNQEDINDISRKLYNTYSELILESIPKDRKKLLDIHLLSFGLNENDIAKKAKSDNRLKGKFHRTFTFLSFLLYLLSAALFGSAICYFVLKYILLNSINCR